MDKIYLLNSLIDNNIYTTTVSTSTPIDKSFLNFLLKQNSIQKFPNHYYITYDTFYEIINGAMLDLINSNVNTFKTPESSMEYIENLKKYNCLFLRGFFYYINSKIINIPNAQAKGVIYRYYNHPTLLYYESGSTNYPVINKDITSINENKNLVSNYLSSNNILSRDIPFNTDYNPETCKLLTIENMSSIF